MTEAGWLASSAPLLMLQHMDRGGSARKLRLFGHACWHRLRHLLGDERLQEFVRLLELHADGLVPLSELAAARAAARAARERLVTAATFGRREWYASLRLVRWGGSSRPRTFALRAARAALGAAVAVGEWAADAEGKAQCDLLREIFGNPFRPVATDQAWLLWNGGVVAKLAASIYEERAFERLPVLADALEEAGCSDADILGHCRGSGQHVRGCWVIDNLMGKS